MRSWAAATGECLLILLGSHATPNLQALALSPCGRFVFSAGTDGALVRWSAFDGNASHALRAHGMPINALAASGEEGLVFTGSYDGTIRAWRFAPPLAWSRLRHRCFPRGFREALRTFVLCVYRRGCVVRLGRG